MAKAEESMLQRVLRWAAWSAAGVFLLVLAGTFAHAWLMAPSAPLQAWHTEVPPELDAAAIDATDWAGYLVAEDKAFAFVAAQVTQRLEPGDRVPFNRYFAGSPVYAPRFRQDWNRSFVMEPVAGSPEGKVVVLLHGLTDSPYSLRHVAQLYAARGWTAIGIRMPAHGTVPAALAKADWEQWTAATRLALREAARRAGPGGIIHVVGYSNGGALAVQYALAAAADAKLPQVARVVLISPMIGLTDAARFAGVAGWPALLPGFAHAAWLDILPEYNPFKYNSFPVNAARESWQLTQAVHDAVETATADGSIRRLPPIMTFQSLADSTVSMPAVVTELYDRLPANGSELIIFDINRAADLGPLLRASVANRMAAVLPERQLRNYRVTVITNASPEVQDVVERSTAAGSIDITERDLGLAFPPQVHSMTHIALPFPPADGLYGAEPDPADNFGIRIGKLAMRGERGVLVSSLETLLRLTSNPFFPYMAERLEGNLAQEPAA